MEDPMTLRNFTKVIAGVLALAAVSFAAPSQAAQPALDFTGFNHQHIGSNFNIGWQFTVGASAITVSQLGYFDLDLNGLATSHDVAIWTTGGVQVVSGTVGSGVAGTLTGKFRYTTIANTVLSANTTYVISGTTGANQDEFALGLTPLTLTGLTVDPGITLNQSALDNGTNPGLAFANLTSGANTLFAGANMIYAAGGGGGGGGGGGVPEPGTVGLLIASGFSSMGLVFRNRKIRK